MITSPTSFPDSAKGPILGYLFQFERALLELARLSSSAESVTIEQVDDVATHTSDGTVIVSIQAKHSIASSGNAYTDTSVALWRTIQIWIEKIKAGIFDANTVYVCCANLPVSDDSLLAKFKTSNFDEIKKSILKLKKRQAKKLKEAKVLDSSSGTSMTGIIKLINFALKNLTELEIIYNKIEIDVIRNIKEDFLNAIHANSAEVTNLQRDQIYADFNGWIVTNCKAKWMNGNIADFKKTEFDNKHRLITNNPAIVNAIFRTKNLLGTIPDNDITARMKDLFVRQIEDISRNNDAKKRIIKNAILDFIFADIELQYVILKGDYTQQDFDDFLEECCGHWQRKFDEIVLKEPTEYTATELNELAIQIFDYVMNHLKIQFLGSYSFSLHNEYLQRGCFLKLSNIPRIGWHPEWENKYKI